MKNLLSITIISLLISCSKEDIQPQNTFKFNLDKDNELNTKLVKIQKNNSNDVILTFKKAGDNNPLAKDSTLIVVGMHIVNGNTYGLIKSIMYADGKATYYHSLSLTGSHTTKLDNQRVPVSVNGSYVNTVTNVSASIQANNYQL